MLFAASPLELLPARAALRGRVAVRAVVTGIGQQRATRAAGALAARPATAVVTGFCGALVDRLREGDVVLAVSWCGAGGAERIEAHRPLLDTAAAAIERAGLRWHAVAGASVERPVNTREERAALHKATGAESVEMEDLAIARRCRELGVPLLSLRVVSDTPATPLPDALLAPEPRLPVRPREVAAAVRVAPHILLAMRRLRAASRAALPAVYLHAEAHR